MKCEITEDGSSVSFPIRYITTEELEQALKEFGMHDGRDMKDIISEVDADNVSKRLMIIENSINFLSRFGNPFLTLFKLSLVIGNCYLCTLFYATL